MGIIGNRYKCRLRKIMDGLQKTVGVMSISLIIQSCTNKKDIVAKAPKRKAHYNKTEIRKGERLCRLSRGDMEYGDRNLRDEKKEHPTGLKRIGTSVVKNHD